MSTDYNGLTRNNWTGTWSPDGDHPIVLDREVRGGLRYVSGDVGDQLTDIPGQRLQPGMLVYLRNTYGAFTGNKYYRFDPLVAEERDESTGAYPNNSGNWSEVEFGGGGGGGGGGYTLFMDGGDAEPFGETTALLRSGNAEDPGA